MTQVVVIGCGVVGAAIAYELAQVSGLSITVVDAHSPATAATGAALGVLMGAISTKLKGQALTRRLASLQWYDQQIPHLESLTGRTVPMNRQGIVRLLFEGEEVERWRSLSAIRSTQGFRLNVHDRAWVRTQLPQVQSDRVIGAVYSPDDRQIDPVPLTQALVAAAEHQGVTFHFGTPVTQITTPSDTRSDTSRCDRVHTDNHSWPVDWLVIAAGLGSTPLTAQLQHPVMIRPVIGQAIHVQVAQPLGLSTFQPVITGEDRHLVPIADRHYWIGATVEFPTDPSGPIVPEAHALETLMQQTIADYPALQEATIVRQWSGQRPRPDGRSAPILERLAGYENVLLATGHYRNGVLLAPASAQWVRATIAAG